MCSNEHIKKFRHFDEKTLDASGTAIYNLYMVERSAKPETTERKEIMSKMLEKVETITTGECEFVKESKALMITSRAAGVTRFPKAIKVVSSHTQREMLFVYDRAAAEAAEGWDGEMAEYIPVDALPNVRKLVMYHG